MRQVASIKTDRSLMPLARLIKDTSKQAFLCLLITSRECRWKIDESYIFCVMFYDSYWHWRNSHGHSDRLSSPGYRTASVRVN